MSYPPKMLTNTEILASKPRQKPYKLGDDGGLFLLVTPGGGRWWRFKFRVHGREKQLSLGIYPDVSQKQARARRDDARRQMADGVDPSAKRRAEKLALGNTFEAIAREWYEKFSGSWAPGYSSKVLRRLELYALPRLGDLPISKVTAPEMLAALRGVEARGKPR